MGGVVGALMARGAVEQAKGVLQRAVDVLPQAKHVELISKFAQLEFKHGSAARGRTTFDGVLANYPKRVDVWSVYLDMELKAGDDTLTRRLFERVTSLRHSSKKTKFFFGRYLAYARDVGDAALVKHVKERARAWVESQAGGATIGLKYLLREPRIHTHKMRDRALTLRRPARSRSQSTTCGASKKVSYCSAPLPLTSTCASSWRSSALGGRRIANSFGGAMTGTPAFGTAFGAGFFTRRATACGRRHQ